VEVQHPAEARATGDLAICPVVIRRSDLLSDELATDALLEPLGHIVLKEFLDQVAQMSLAEDDEVIETLVLDGLYKALRINRAFRRSSTAWSLTQVPLPGLCPSP
jgi:hypothetical protein